MAVRIFSAETDLAASLADVCGDAGCEATSVLVQDYVPNDFELRAFVVRGAIRHVVYSTFGGFNQASCIVEPFPTPPSRPPPSGCAAA